MAVLCGMPTIHYSAGSPTIWSQYTKTTDRQTTVRCHRANRFTNKNQLIAKHNMTYVNVSHLGFPRKVPPRVLSHLTFVANHPTTSTMTHFRYLLLHWLHHKTTLLALFPVIRFLAIFLTYDVHRVSTKFAVRSNVILSHS